MLEGRIQTKASDDAAPPKSSGNGGVGHIGASVRRDLRPTTTSSWVLWITARLAQGYMSCSQMSMKWWHTLFWWILDAAMMNAYCVCTFAEKEAGHKPDRRDVFVEKVMLELTRLGDCVSPSAPLKTPKLRRRTGVRWGIDRCEARLDIFSQEALCAVFRARGQGKQDEAVLWRVQKHLCHAHFAEWQCGPGKMS